MKTNYSGRTTAYRHKHTKWNKGTEGIEDYEKNLNYLTGGKLDWNKVPHDGNPAIQNKIVFEVQWSDCPVEVCEEVRKLWRDRELGNDHYYVGWEMVEMELDYPIIAEYLKSKDVTDCLIHYWW